MHESVRTLDDVKDIRKARRLAPKREDLRRMFPGRERVEVDSETGKSQWVFDVVTHEPNGSQTRDGRELEGAMRPFMAAEAGRSQKIGARTARPVPLKDETGNLRLVAPHLADATAKKHGWHSAERRRGNTFVGPGGMLFRLVHRDWMPLGVNCLGTPLRGSARTPRKVVQLDPDGHPWRWIEGSWRRI